MQHSPVLFINVFFVTFMERIDYTRSYDSVWPSGVEGSSLIIFFFFLLRRCDGQARVYRRREESYHEPCVLRHDRFGGGGVMICGGISENHKTDLVFIDGELIAHWYRYKPLPDMWYPT